MPKSQQSALNLHPDLHALPSIPPHQIPKSRQSVALSLGPLLIHLASPHYWTGRYKIPWTLPPSRNQIFLYFASLIHCHLMAFRKQAGVNPILCGHSYTDTWTAGSKKQLVLFLSIYLFNNNWDINLNTSNAGWKCKTKRLTDYEEMPWQQAWCGWNMLALWKDVCFWMVRFKSILPSEGRECVVLLQHNLLFYQ